MPNVNRYSYEELKNAAIGHETAENLNALGEWFEQYGMDYWNGECFDVDSSHSLYPIHKCIDEENEEYERIGYTFDRNEMWV